MSEKKEKSKLSLSAKADKFDVPLSTLKKVFRRGVAAWNSGHRPGTTPQQWGHARVNSFLRKGKTYHTADKDLREDAEQLNELDIETYNKYIDATYSQSPAAQVRKVGQPKYQQRTLGRLRARKLKQKQIDKPEHQEKLAQFRREHEALHSPADPSGRGYGQGRYMGDHVEHYDVNVLFEKAMAEDDWKDPSEVNPFEYKGVLVPKRKDSMDPENQPGVQRVFIPASPEKRASASSLRKKLEAQGMSDDQIRREIWKQLQVFHSTIDNEYDEEISDDQLQVGSGMVGVEKGPAADVIRHDKLKSRVPNVFNRLHAEVETITPDEYKKRDLAAPEGLNLGLYTVNPRHATIEISGTADRNKKTAAHELQHHLDRMFNRTNRMGGNPEFIKHQNPGISDDEAYEMYKQLPGEKSGRLAGNRWNLTPAERLEIYPGDSISQGSSPAPTLPPPGPAPAPDPRQEPIDKFKRIMRIKYVDKIKDLNEMQLVGTDEYRQYAIAMTPGQDQEIEDAFPSEVYGTEVYEPQSQEESTTAESDGSIESGAYSTSGNSFRSIRKKLQEQEVEELEDEEQIEGDEEEEEGENDGAEDGVDFTPNLKTTKARRYVPQEYAGNAVSGFPVLGISEGDVVPVDFASAAKLRKHPAYDPNKPVGRDASGKVWQKVDLGKNKFEIQKPFAGMNPLMRGGQQIGFTTSKSGEMASFLDGKTQAPPPARRPVIQGPDGKEYNIIGSRSNVQRRELEQVVLDHNKKLAERQAAESSARELAKAELLKQQAAELAAKTARLTTIKSVLKKVPLVGAALSIPSSVSRAKEGDYLGATGELASGIASIFPGTGTAASTAIDTSLLARDIQKQRANLKESTLDEAVNYHTDNNISLVENIFRPGSDMFFAMLLEAKRQYAEGTLIPKDEFEQDLLESDIGEVAEYEGEMVLLDFPYEEELDEACWDGYEQKGMKKKGKKMVPNCVPVSEESDPTKGKGIGKPFRTGGGGAVYVRTGNGGIKKVNFSQSGMKKRFNEPARVKSFVARHHCYTNKDRTSASYWACRWPRYFSDSGQQWW